MLSFGIKDIVDILIVALMLYYLYRLMKNSGTLSLFYGVLAFIAIWVISFEIFNMRLTGTIVDKFMSIGLIVLVILFQDQIKRFLIYIGSRGRWTVFRKLFRHHEDNEEQEHSRVMSVVYACMSMAKSKTGALIVFQRKVPLASDREHLFQELTAARRCDDNSRPSHQVSRLHPSGEPRHEYSEEPRSASSCGFGYESGH